MKFRAIQTRQSPGNKKQAGLKHSIATITTEFSEVRASHGEVILCALLKGGKRIRFGHPTPTLFRGAEIGLWPRLKWSDKRSRNEKRALI